MGSHRVRGLKDVGSCESEQAVARAEQAVLAAIVVHQAVPVSAAVVLETEFVCWVVQVRAPEQASVFIAKRDLGKRAR